MALSGLDIYKLLQKSNCRKCGLPTCLAFAMQLAKKAVPIEKCPFISEEAKAILESQALPPVRPIVLGANETKFEIGNETVMFRHEEKFRNPPGIGFIIDDNLTDAQIKSKVDKIEQLEFVRVGQTLNVNLIALKQNKDPKRFIEAVGIVLAHTKKQIALISEDLTALKGAAEISKGRAPLIYCANEANYKEVGLIAKEYELPLVVLGRDFDILSRLTKELNALGVKNLILDTGLKPVTEKIWDLTQIRRQALKKTNRSLGYPTLAIVDNADPFDEAIEATAYIAKYAGMILIKGIESWELLSILTLRQNIYTDPQKPLQIDPKLYPIGKVNEKSPLLVTTNFSLSYFTVLGEVEASKIPSYILSVDTQGMSVLTAWAAEKFNAETITKSLETSGVKEIVKHKNLIIPGYVAMMSGDLEDQSGYKIIVGPKEAAGLPAFLKNLN
ncbi:MAG: acetyl-CoA decarbonylase/synthase complex subunit gamma [Candidatus Omnitrophica bacterium]|nr:acetyl-CoA decarbonylase/synthase complex subunit gamma [Candidatus Omnitrophota bacterium]